MPHFLVEVKLKQNCLKRELYFLEKGIKEGVFNMKRYLLATIAYLTTGIGFYHAIFGGSIVYGSLILVIGLIGILQDVFYKKLYTV